MTAPAGAATAAALPRTNTVLSIKERTSILPICGRRNGGSSSVNDDGSPLSSVADSILDTANVANIPSNITKVSAAADKTLPANPPALTKKSEIIVMIIGKRPLHGTKTFVSMAISRSRLLSIMRHPTMPAALHPKPIHIVYTILYHEVRHMLYVTQNTKHKRKAAKIKQIGNDDKLTASYP